MAVAFMAELEKSPETYDDKFDDVLEGRASQIREKILELVKPGMKVLDLGCGPGLFAMEAAKKGAVVVGIDADINMIALAKIRAAALENAPVFIQGDVLSIAEDIDLRATKGSQEEEEIERKRFDLIVSTFLLSELKSPQRDLFMLNVKMVLRKEGVFVFAAETVPSKSSERKAFWKNRDKVEKSSRRRLLPPIDNLEIIVEESGLAISSTEKYGPEITLVVGKQGDSVPLSKYQTRKKRFQGVRAKARIWYNHLTGGWRGVPINTGLYKVGNPTPESPVIVTANYELTYYTVMRALSKDKIDAWVLVCDTAGINVWCAARGIHFDSDDVIQMVRLTKLQEFVNHRELILPQLSAAGMDPSSIRNRTGFRVRYGPVRIQDLSEWLELDKPRPKPEKMAKVTFNLRERMEQTVAHIPFLFAVLLGKPILIILGITALVNIGLAVMIPSVFQLIYPFSIEVVLLVGKFTLALFGNAFVLGVIFPILPSKGNSFWRRGLGLAGITLPFAGIIMFILATHWTVFVVWLVIQFVMATSLTMDWSGMTSVSDPKVIRREYPYMITTIKLGVIFIVVFTLLTAIMGW